MTCTDSCNRPRGNQMAHCGACHRTFGGIRGFDVHRRGGRCADPAQLGYTERDRIWRAADSGWRAAHTDKGLSG